MANTEKVLAALGRKFVLLVMRTLGDTTMSYVEIQRVLKIKPVPLVRALRALLSVDLALRKEEVNGRVYYSLTQKLMKFDDSTVLCPGHNYSEKPTTTMGSEKKA